MNISDPIAAEITSVSFASYSPAELKKLSVLQVSQPILFDVLGHPNDGGLYDPSLGPMSERDPGCRTCSLPYAHCPGHFGHIQLLAKVYHPLYFKLLYKLLQSTCYYCHHLRVTPTLMEFFKAKLILLHAGLVKEAAECDLFLLAAPKPGNKSGAADSTAMASVISKEGGKTQDDSDDDDDQSQCEEDNTLAGAANGSSSTDSGLTSSLVAKLKAHVKKCLASAPENSARSKSILKTEALKKLERAILGSISPLSCPHCGGQSPKFRHEAMTKVFERPLSMKQRGLMESRGKHYQKLIFSEASSASATGTDAKVEKKEEEQEEESSSASASASAISSSSHTTTSAWNTTDVYLTPLQVYAHISMLWKNHQDFFDLLYGSTEPKAKTRTSSPDVFFISVLPVTPNRFRPLSKMGDMTYEHPQNVHLTAVLKSNHGIGELREQEKRALVTLDPVSDPKLYDNTKAEYLLKMIETWILLQTAVNDLLDNSRTAPAGGTPPPPGIRQILEKKEGLFRKHMMGKRVNFAARSVISPDPYIETNEIGVCVAFILYVKPQTNSYPKSDSTCLCNKTDVP